MKKVEGYVLEQDDKENPPIIPSQVQNQVHSGNITGTSSTLSMNVASDKNATQEYHTKRIQYILQM